MAGPGFAVDLSGLERFRGKLARSIEQNFGAGAAGGSPAAGGTNAASAEFGRFHEAASAHGVYGPSRGSMLDLLKQVDDLISSAHTGARNAASSYQHADGVSQRGADDLRGQAGAPLPRPRSQ